MIFNYCKNYLKKPTPNDRHTRVAFSLHPPYNPEEYIPLLTPSIDYQDRPFTSVNDIPVKMTHERKKRVGHP